MTRIDQVNFKVGQRVSKQGWLSTCHGTVVDVDSYGEPTVEFDNGEVWKPYMLDPDDLTLIEDLGVNNGTD